MIYSQREDLQDRIEIVIDKPLVPCEEYSRLALWEIYFRLLFVNTRYSDLYAILCHRRFNCTLDIHNYAFFSL